METMNFGEEQNNSAPKAPRNKKLIWSGIILAVLILSIAGWQYWQYTHSLYYQQMQAVKNLEKMAKESDKYGGKTPEETVRLFTEAIKKGDFELASKYGNKEKILPVLEKMKNDNKIDQLINWLEIGKINEFSDKNYSDLKVKKMGQEIWIMGLFKSNSGTWKIVEF